MESQKTTRNTEERPSDGIGGAVITGVLLVLAGYGLYKLVSKETETRKSIADRKEADFIKEIIGKE
jgi:hypothetical protein